MGCVPKWKCTDLPRKVKNHKVHSTGVGKRDVETIFKTERSRKMCIRDSSAVYPSYRIICWFVAAFILFFESRQACYIYFDSGYGRIYQWDCVDDYFDADS